MTGVSYFKTVDQAIDGAKFPYPLEVNGVSYFDLSGINDQTLLNVSVPSRGDLGVLLVD